MKQRSKRRLVAPGGSRRAPSPQEPRSVLKVGSAFYVLASSLSSRRTTRVLADGRSFAIFDAGGDIIESPLEALGLFHRDTRYLSRFELRVAGETPSFLNSFLSDDKAQLRVNLTNPDLGAQGQIADLPRDSIQLERSWVLGQATLFHRLVVRITHKRRSNRPSNFASRSISSTSLKMRESSASVTAGAPARTSRAQHQVSLPCDSIRGLRVSELYFIQTPTHLDSDSPSPVYLDTWSPTLTPRSNLESFAAIRTMTLPRY